MVKYTLYDVMAKRKEGAKEVVEDIAKKASYYYPKTIIDGTKWAANTASLAESRRDYNTDKSIQKKFGSMPSFTEREDYTTIKKELEDNKKSALINYKESVKAKAKTAAAEKKLADSAKLDVEIKELEKARDEWGKMDKTARIEQVGKEIEEKIKQKNDAYNRKTTAPADKAPADKAPADKAAADKAAADKAPADKAPADKAAADKAGKPVAGIQARPGPHQPAERVGDTKKASLNITELFNIQMTLTNLFQYVSFSSPILIVFFITLYSIVQDKILSGLIFNMGIVLISSIVYMLKHLLKNKQDSKASPFCNVLPSPFTIKTYDNANNTHYYYDSPSFSSSVLAFSATYLIYPMIIMNQQNVSLLVVAIVLVLINAVTEVKYGCSGLFGVILGILIGVIFAILYYSLLMSSDHTSKYLYFAEKESNNTQCRKPGTQNFKCSLYKNGVAVI